MIKNLTTLLLTLLVSGSLWAQNPEEALYKYFELFNSADKDAINEASDSPFVFLIGNNKRLIRTDSVNLSLPLVLGNPTIDDFFLIKEDIFKSMMNFQTIKKFYFFPSGRWDLELKNGTLIKLPSKDVVDSINDYYKLLKLPQFKKIKFFDMRIKNQIIINEL